MAKPIRILIADDHPIVRQGLAAILKFQPNMELVGEAVDGVEAVSKARDLRPDVIVMDLRMPAKDGITAIREIVETQPDARILVLSGFAEEEEVLPAVQAGALGFSLKGAEPDQILQAIQAVSQGASFLHPSIAGKLRHMVDNSSSSSAGGGLTHREMDVVSLVAQGLSNKEIARRLHLSNNTVLSHVQNIFSKLQVNSRTQAALQARDRGLVQTPVTSNPRPPVRCHLPFDER